MEDFPGRFGQEQAVRRGQKLAEIVRPASGIGQDKPVVPGGQVKRIDRV